MPEFDPLPPGYPGSENQIPLSNKNLEDQLFDRTDPTYLEARKKILRYVEWAVNQEQAGSALEALGMYHVEIIELRRGGDISRRHSTFLHQVLAEMTDEED